MDAIVLPPPPDRPIQNPIGRTVVVSIGKHPEVSVTSEVYDLRHLGSQLFDIFKTRSERVLFVRAHPGTEYQHAAQVIDIAKGDYVDKVDLLGDE